jgi:hypothetical protein
VNRQDLATSLGTAAQDAAEYLGLTVHRLVIAGTGIEFHFADVSRFVEKPFLEIDLFPALRHQLRVQAPRGSDVFRRRSQLVVARPGLRGRGDGEREDPESVAFGDECFEVGIQVEVTVEIDEPRAVISVSAAGDNVSTSRSS